MKIHPFCLEFSTAMLANILQVESTKEEIEKDQNMAVRTLT